MTTSEIRQYEVTAGSTDTFGRVLCSARNHHFVVDGPEQNGCPGEEITPGELFLSGVAACGVELIQVLAKSARLPLRAARVRIHGVIDRLRPIRSDLSLFNAVRLEFHLSGISDGEARELVEKFKGR